VCGWEDSERVLVEIMHFKAEMEFRTEQTLSLYEDFSHLFFKQGSSKLSLEVQMAIFFITFLYTLSGISLREISPVRKFDTPNTPKWIMTGLGWDL
jgi:hypothetical protein